MSQEQERCHCAPLGSLLRKSYLYWVAIYLSLSLSLSPSLPLSLSSSYVYLRLLCLSLSLSLSLSISLSLSLLLISYSSLYLALLVLICVFLSLSQTYPVLSLLPFLAMLSISPLLALMLYHFSSFVFYCQLCLSIISPLYLSLYPTLLNSDPDTIELNTLTHKNIIRIDFAIARTKISDSIVGELFV